MLAESTELYTVTKAFHKFRNVSTTYFTSCKRARKVTILLTQEKSPTVSLTQEKSPTVSLKQEKSPTEKCPWSLTCISM